MPALLLAAGMALGALWNGGLRAWGPRRAQDPVGVRLEASAAVESAALFGLGMRRLAADLGLVRLLVYYGTPEKEGLEGAGAYREIGPRARRVLDLDPSFAYPALYASGALAFNLDRPDEALDLLEYALRRDPGNWQYRAYVGAIGFHRRGDAAGVLRLLEPVLFEPDCPTMLRSMMAFLYRRAGRRDKAATLYRLILETSRDEGYRGQALKGLAELGMPAPR